MTIFASLLNLPMLVIGTMGLILLVVLMEERRENTDSYLTRWNIINVVLLFVLWAILSTSLRFVWAILSAFLQFGTIEEVNFTDAMIDVFAYGLTVCFAFLMEKRRW